MAKGGVVLDVGRVLHIEYGCVDTYIYIYIHF